MEGVVFAGAGTGAGAGGVGGVGAAGFAREGFAKAGFFTEGEAFGSSLEGVVFAGAGTGAGAGAGFAGSFGEASSALRMLRRGRAFGISFCSTGVSTRVSVPAEDAAAEAVSFLKAGKSAAFSASSLLEI